MAMKHAVVLHRPDGSTWIAEILPNQAEAREWAQTFRDRKPDAVYTVEPLASVLAQ